MMCTFFLENIYHFHQVLKMLLDLEKVKQPLPENILLRRARIPAQVLLRLFWTTFPQIHSCPQH